jgi:hypothetical protein
MLCALPGVSSADRNVLGAQRDGELDLHLVNEKAADGLPGFGRDVIVESKSSREPLDARGVSQFGRLVKDRRSDWSLIVALAGITSGDGGQAAQTVIRDYARDGHFIMVLVESEMRAVRSAAHFAAVIERKRQKQFEKLHAVTFRQRRLT